MYEIVTNKLPFNEVVGKDAILSIISESIFFFFNLFVSQHFFFFFVFSQTRHHIFLTRVTLHCQN
jgi:hypothetical protein